MTKTTTLGQPLKYEKAMTVYSIRLPAGLCFRLKGLDVDVQRGIIVSGLEGLSGRVRGKRLSELDKEG